jgi:hypothetical protein
MKYKEEKKILYRHPYKSNKECSACKIQIQRYGIVCELCTNPHCTTCVAKVEIFKEIRYVCEKCYEHYKSEGQNGKYSCNECEEPKKDENLGWCDSCNKLCCVDCLNECNRCDENEDLCEDCTFECEQCEEEYCKKCMRTQELCYSCYKNPKK